mgnify:CR=1 FL=1
MMLPTTFNQTPYQLGNLKPKQVSFLQHLYDAGHNTNGDVVFKRNYLKTVANLNGISWAPAWIVKDVSRVTDRGMYAVPELNELIALAVANDTPVVEDVSPGHETDGDSLADTNETYAPDVTHVVTDDMGEHTVSDDVLHHVVESS